MPHSAKSRRRAGANAVISRARVRYGLYLTLADCQEVNRRIRRGDGLNAGPLTMKANLWFVTIYNVEVAFVHSTEIDGIVSVLSPETDQVIGMRFKVMERALQKRGSTRKQNEAAALQPGGQAP